MNLGFYSRCAAAAAMAVGLMLSACHHSNTGPAAGPITPPPPPPPPPQPPPPCPPPTVDLRANGDTITRGQSATLTWTAANANGVSIAPEIGQVQPTGNRQIQPQSSVTYTATVTSPCGSASSVARITVNAAPPPQPNPPRVETPQPPPPVAPVREVVPPRAPEPAPPSRGIVNPQPPVSVGRGQPTATVPDRVATFEESVLNVLFDYDQSELRADQMPQLQKDAAYLKQNAAVRFTVEGHADERGNQEYNLALGVRRANTVAKYLIAQGIAESRISTVSFGKERPICKDTNGDEACHQQNRRAAFARK